MVMQIGSLHMCAELNSSDTDYVVRTISLDKNPKVSMGGFHVLPDYSIADYITEREIRTGYHRLV